MRATNGEETVDDSCNYAAPSCGQLLAQVDDPMKYDDDDDDADARKMQQCSPNYCADSSSNNNGGGGNDDDENGQVVVTLQVPVVNKPRASSIDASCFRHAGLKQVVSDSAYYAGAAALSLMVPACIQQQQVRATSIDVTLPTSESQCYKAIVTSPASSSPKMNNKQSRK